MMDKISEREREGRKKYIIFKRDRGKAWLPTK